MKTGKRVLAYLLTLALIVTSVSTGGFGSGIMTAKAAEDTSEAGTITYEKIAVSSLEDLDVTGKTQYVLVGQYAGTSNAVALDSDSVSGTAVTLSDNTLTGTLDASCYWKIKTTDNSNFTLVSGDNKALVCDMAVTAIEFVNASSIPSDKVSTFNIKFGSSFNATHTNIMLHSIYNTNKYVGATKDNETGLTNGFGLNENSNPWNGNVNQQETLAVYKVTDSTPKPDQKPPTNELIGKYLFEGNLINEAKDDGSSAVIWNSYINNSDKGTDIGQAADGTAFPYREGYEGLGEAADFTGTGTKGLKLDVLPSGNTFTISFDMKIDSAGRFDPVVFLYKNDTEWMSIKPKHTVEEDVMGPQVWCQSSEIDDNVLDIPAAAPKKVSLNKWATVTVIVNNGTLEFYVNAQKIGEGTVPDFITEDSASSADAGIYIGINNWDTPFDGAIDNLYVYDGAITIDEVYEMKGRSTEMISIFDDEDKNISGKTIDHVITSSTKSIQLTAKIAGSAKQGTAYEWSSSDPAIATVNSAGDVTFHKAGSVTITVKGIEDERLSTQEVYENSVTYNLTNDMVVHRPTDADADDYFPAQGKEGNVTINKNATGENYATTGTAKVSLDILGIPSQQPVDIILLMDVSRSMVALPTGTDTSTYPGGTDSNRAGDLNILNYDKMNRLRDSAVSFVETMLGGSNTKNRIALVQFANDKQDADGNYYEVNSRVLSYFEGSATKDKLISTIYNGVDTQNTYEFTGEPGSVTDSTQTLNGAGTGYPGYEQLADMSDVGMTLSTEGGTNYGLGLKMVERVIAADTLKSEDRKKIVVFMTDGGPSVMNLAEDSVLTQKTNGAATDEKRNTEYNEISLKGATAWADFASNRHLLAKSRIEDEGYEIITIGYDLVSDNTGYFGTDPVAAAVISENILKSISTTEADYYEAVLGSLDSIYAKIASSVSSSITDTVIRDTIGDDFELRVLPFYRTESDMQADKATKPSIEIYEGGKGSGSDGRIEKVTFSGDTLTGGITVKSDQVDGILCTITPENKESYVINAKYFTYDAATKTFTYNAGTLKSNTKYKIQYDAYLKGSNSRYEMTMGYLESENDLNRTPESIYETGFQQGNADDFKGTDNISIEKENGTIGNEILKVPGRFVREGYAVVPVNFQRLGDKGVTGLTISMRVKDGEVPSEDGTGYTVDGWNTLFSINWDGTPVDGKPNNGFFIVRADGEIVINTTGNDTSCSQPFAWIDAPDAGDSVTNATTWTTVTLTVSGDRIRVYINGELKKEYTELGGGSLADLWVALQSADNLWLGSQGSNWLEWWSYNGYYDDITVFASELTAEQIANIDRRVPNSSILHDTNLIATANYSNVRGDNCEQTYEIPAMPWKAGKITYKFYLAKEREYGIVPIDYNAKIIDSTDPEDFVIISQLFDSVDFSTISGTTEEKPGGTDFATQAGKSGVLVKGIEDGIYAFIDTDNEGNPTGTYTIYNNDGTYVETVTGRGVILKGNDGTATDTVVYFPITLTDVTTNKYDVTVLDYGLPVHIDLLANDNVGYILSKVSLIGLQKGLTDLHNQENTVDTRFVDNENSALNINLEFTPGKYDVSDYAFKNQDKLIENVANTAGYSVENSALVIDGSRKTPGLNDVMHLDNNILNNASSLYYSFATWVYPSGSPTDPTDPSGNTILFSEGNDRWLEITLDDPVAGAVEGGKALNIRVGVRNYYEVDGERKLASTEFYNVESTTVIPYGQWSFVSCVYENGIIKLYYNGKAVSSSYIANIYYEQEYVDYMAAQGTPITGLDDENHRGIPYGSLVPAPFNSYNQSFYVGASVWSRSLLYGKLDGMKLYSTNLSQEQVAALYNATKAGYADGVTEYGNDGAEFKKDGTNPLLALKGGNTYRDAAGKYGTAAIGLKDSLTKKNADAVFTMNKMLEGEENFQYALRYNYTDYSEPNYVYGNLKILPANTVYYEDNFAGITYNPNQEVTTGSGNTGIKQWQTIVSDGVKDSQDFQLAEMQGSDVNYGFDSHYADNQKDSNNTVTEMGSMAVATFTFTGTGFDIISRTNATTGDVAVVVKDANKKAIIASIHNLYYDDGDLYQIPVIRVVDLPYGTYTVQIQPRYKNTANENQIFYLDGIRIYNPIGNAANDALRESYYADGENGAEFKEIRNELLGQNRMQLITYAADGTIALSNAYTTTEYYNSGENDYQAKQSAGGWNDYLKRGPNNELYLSPGQAILFQIQNTAETTYDEKKNTLQVGAKIASGSQAQMTVKVGNGNTVAYDINSRAEMYYDITNADCSQSTSVIIANTGSSEGFISLTNLKVNQYTVVDIFTPAEVPAEIPAYYTKVEGTNNVYSFNNGVYEEYRIYGSYSNGVEGSTVTGWYICDKDGHLQGYETAGAEAQETFRYALNSTTQEKLADKAKTEGMERYQLVAELPGSNKIVYKKSTEGTTQYYVWGAKGQWNAEQGWEALEENRFYECDQFGYVIDSAVTATAQQRMATARLATVNSVMSLYNVQVTVAEESEQDSVTEPESKPESKPETTVKPNVNTVPNKTEKPVTKTYTVKYVLNGGKNVKANKSVYKAGTTLKLKAPKRVGYQFAGWYTNKGLTKRITSVKNKNVTVYAKWKKLSLKPTKVKQAQINKTKASISWKKVTGATGYEIKIAKNKKFTGKVITVRTSSEKRTVKNLQRKQTYYVKVRAYVKDSAGKKVYSNYSKAVKMKRKG